MGSLFSPDIVFPTLSTIAWNRFTMDEPNILRLWTGSRLAITNAANKSKKDLHSPTSLQPTPFSNLTLIPLTLPPSEPQFQPDDRWVLVNSLNTPPISFKIPINRTHTFGAILDMLSAKAAKLHPELSVDQWQVCIKASFTDELFSPNPSLIAWNRFSEESPDTLEVWAGTAASFKRAKSEAQAIQSPPSRKQSDTSSSSSSPSSYSSSSSSHTSSFAPSSHGSASTPSSIVSRSFDSSPLVPSALRSSINNTVLDPDPSPPPTDTSGHARRRSTGSWEGNFLDSQDTSDSISQAPSTSAPNLPAIIVSPHHKRHNSTEYTRDYADDEFPSDVEERPKSFLCQSSPLLSSLDTDSSDSGCVDKALPEKSLSAIARWRNKLTKGRSSRSAAPSIPCGHHNILQFGNVSTSDIRFLRKLTDTRGGSGANIWLASVMGWVCAVKIIPREMIGSSLIQEIGILEALPSSPFTVRYLGHSIDPNQICLYLELFDCQLEEYFISFQGELPAFSPALSLRLCWQIAKALAFLHSHSIVHRDIKCSNVFVRLRDGTPLYCALGDFDTAKNYENSKLHTVCGTPNYMAPEVLEAKTNGPYSHLCDLFSLGMLMFHIITGTAPFSGVPLLTVVNLILGGVQPPAPEFVVSNPVLYTIYTLALECSAFDPSSRLPLSKLISSLEALALNSDIVLEVAPTNPVDDFRITDRRSPVRRKPSSPP